MTNLAAASTISKFQ